MLSYGFRLTAQPRRCKELIGIFVEGYGARRQLHPAMPAAIVNGDPGRRKVRIRKRAYGDAH